MQSRSWEHKKYNVISLMIYLLKKRCIEPTHQFNYNIEKRRLEKTTLNVINALNIIIFLHF
jgi:hypothetical protein